jgi:diketogulonate reductase-like aldo/keto reductase
VWVGWAIHHAIDQGLVTRDQLFITTKLSNIGDAGYDNVKALIKQQLQYLQVSYIDLYMLHSPMGELQLETWHGSYFILIYLF